MTIGSGDFSEIVQQFSFCDLSKEEQAYNKARRVV
jgi:hypothetical protein